ncbi:sigma-70 family RNA polymerase sigma factor [Brevibacillus invocatus]|uniref:sigma-70 family RNA polymerase sigma factor n=1 Tax=Brevibacillus invocatus TaxID=173959 RepID=UPI00203AC83F|nr:sigma-70 family RNA polymerase sigma factor [Brevibacillus invocatus]MCM3079621.1 sigma-70 family RNA polymerase sigma factor [Brevibacillus invocatus]MCM3429819.1 sigma-70 family RNA polymerase sigma factor [Brevibacillus invocatus]
MQDLLQGYIETRRMLKRMRSNCQGEQLATDRQLLGAMLRESEWIIEWLNTGRMPGNRRGIERRAAYEREKPIDPNRLQSFVSCSSAGSPVNLTEWERYRLDDAMSELSEREKECYVLTHGECFSFEQTAELLGISKSSVQTHVNRARSKITERLSSSLFLT